jgi:protease I
MMLRNLANGMDFPPFTLKKENMKYDLKDRKVAILATHGFEEVELTKPVEALKKAGAEVHIIAPERGHLKAWNKDNWGKTVDVDRSLEEAKPEDYHSLMLPGGVMNPDQLRMNEKAIEFTRHFFIKGKPVSAICHAPQLLIETDALNGRVLTSYPSLKTDLTNAGARWENREVITDQGLTTSRNPDDLDAFIDKMLEEISEGKHERQKTAIA